MVRVLARRDGPRRSSRGAASPRSGPRSPFGVAYDRGTWHRRRGTRCGAGDEPAGRQMALAAPVLEQAYRYPFPSALVGQRGRSAGCGSRRRAGRPRTRSSSAGRSCCRSSRRTSCWRSATWPVPGSTCRRRCWPGSCCSPIRSRPAPTSASIRGVLRVLQRLRPGRLPAGRLRRRDRRAGTTNVDMGADLRAALAGVQERSALGLAVGASSVEVAADGADAVERRVPLPSRWVRGFLEVQAIQAELAPVAVLDGPGRGRSSGRSRSRRRRGRSGSRRAGAACG